MSTVFGYNPLTDNWHCTACGVEMGKDNSRQLCGKWICVGIPPQEEEKEEKDEKEEPVKTNIK